MTTLTFLSIALSIYALTFLFASSHSLKGLREWLGDWLDELWPGREYKMEECRMCVGVYVMLGLWFGLAITPWWTFSEGGWFFAAYGLSYFLATQER